MKITVDRDLCIGAASCIGVAPEVFKLDDEDKSVPYDPQGASPEVIRQAAAVCPVGAIIITEESS